MIVWEVGFDSAKDVLAHSSRSGAEISDEGREHRVRIYLSGHCRESSRLATRR